MIPVLPHVPYSDGRAELRLDEKVLQVGWIRTEAKGPPSGFVTGDKGDKISTMQAVGGFPGGSDSKESACNAGDWGLIPGSGRPPGEGNGNPLKCSCLENSMDRGAWWATVHEVPESQTRLRD